MILKRNIFSHLIATILNRYRTASKVRLSIRWQLIPRLSNLRLKERDLEMLIRQIGTESEPYLFITKFLLTKLRLLA